MSVCDQPIRRHAQLFEIIRQNNLSQRACEIQVAPEPAEQERDQQLAFAKKAASSMRR